MSDEKNKPPGPLARLIGKCAIAMLIGLFALLLLLVAGFYLHLAWDAAVEGWRLGGAFGEPHIFRKTETRPGF